MKQKNLVALIHCDGKSFGRAIVALVPVVKKEKK